jgi:hypothetical protein
VSAARRSASALLGAIALAAIASCAGHGARAAATPAAPVAWPQAYQDAIKDAQDPEPAKIATNLVAIVRTNPSLVWKDTAEGARVLMVSLVSNTSYYQGSIGRPYDTGTHDIWVTASPELQTRCWAPGFSRGSLPMRLRQVLGLTPDAAVAGFVEFWILPAQMFRPAPDNEVTDATAGLEFPAGTESWYRRWFNDLRAHQYFESQQPLNHAYPWTQLGYTYDWGDAAHHQGVSEFVVKTHSSVLVNAIIPVGDYCREGAGLPSSRSIPERRH